MRVEELRRWSAALGFTPRDQVRWLSPRQLWRTGAAVALSSVFADYTDRREAQAALPAPRLSVHPDAGELWLDHVADLGDGFDPTYTVALLASRAELDVGAGLLLPRGRVLVMGGDEVYPTPSAVEYEDRTKGPYRAASAGPDEADTPGTWPADAERPVLLALPGNHDWYDGLTAFLRVFAQRRGVGAWRTVQTRSYFAVELPRRWWLVGLDTQLGTYVDDPQVRYFREHLSARLRPGDGVIVAVPSPTWVRTGEGDRDAFDSLHWFERQVVENCVDVDAGTSRPTGAGVRLWITGDRHHYARYARERDDQDPDDAVGAAQLVTCGLGGSYLSDTHRLPERLVLPPPASRSARGGRATAYTLSARWPSVEQSRGFVRGVVSFGPRGLPFRNPGAWRLAGALQSVLLLVLASVLGVETGRTPVGVLTGAAMSEVGGLALQATTWAAVAGALWALAPLVRRRRPRLPSGITWAVVGQVVVALAALAVKVAVPWPPGWPPWLVLGLAVLGAWFVAGLVATYAFALFVLSSRSRGVQGWQSAAQSEEERKGFVRMHIGPDAALTLYAVVVDAVCHDWRLVPEPTETTGAGTVRPVPATDLPRPYLAEPPVRIPRTPSAAGRPVGDAVSPRRPRSPGP